MINQTSIHQLLITCLLVIFACFNGVAQPPFEISRTSKLQFSLPNNETKTFPIELQEADELTIDFKCRHTINFSILTPEGVVIYQEVSSARKNHNWSKIFALGGIYQVSFQDVSFLKLNKIEAVIKLKRPAFYFGSGKSEKTSPINDRIDTLITQGTFKASFSDDRIYPLSLIKGDTFHLKLSAKKGVIPAFNILNDKGEFLHSQFISKNPFEIYIPALTDQLITLTFVPPSFLDKVKRFVPGIINIALSKQSPKRYSDTLIIPVNIDSIQINEYDTLAEVYLDTLVYLGAKRDIVNSSTGKIEIAFTNPDEIICWGIIYGIGNDFSRNISNLDERHPTEGGFLEAYCFGEINSLPKNRNASVSFTFSEDLRNAFVNGSNYAKVEYFSDLSSINMSNKSQSVSQTVQLRIVSFRKVLK
jgi:hypothetical protein